MVSNWHWILLVAWLSIISNAKHNAKSQEFSIRNRRQHSNINNYAYINTLFNATQPLLKDNILLGLNTRNWKIEESGNWGEWNEATECSRHCGGGVASQTRECLEQNPSDCIGPVKRYFSCNIEECDPRTMDFREEQCSQFNSVMSKGSYYTWLPYKQGNNPCELNCYPEGEVSYQTFAARVIDGTKCYDDGSRNICVAGQCVPVGCDNMLGSTLRLDKCQVCGGDGTSCHVIHGQFEQANLPIGYTDMFQIQAGAFNIKIEEIVPTSNYISVKSLRGNSFLNGNWKIDFSKKMEFAGTVFNYVRDVDNNGEILTATGPINEPLIISLLALETNKGILYEYSIPRENTNLPHSRRTDYPDSKENYLKNLELLNRNNQENRFRYQWWYGNWTKCTRKCNGGAQQRHVICLKLSLYSLNQTATIHNLNQGMPANSEIVQDQYCDQSRKPVSQQICNIHVCPPIWQVGHWSKCDCELGISVRSVSCKKGTLHPDTGRPISEIWVVAEEEECEELRGKRKPPSIKSCEIDKQDCIKLKEFKDKLKIEASNNTNVKEDDIDDLIDEFAHVPPIRNCEVTYAFDWEVGNWTKCDSRCGLGYQTRNVTCVKVQNVQIYENIAGKLPDIYCVHKPKPEDKKECNEIPCNGVGWVTSDWTPCESPNYNLNEVQTESSLEKQIDFETDKPIFVDKEDSIDNKNYVSSNNLTVLSETQTRMVVCATEDGTIYPDELCGIENKPITFQHCNSKNIKAQWFISDWSNCSVTDCGVGIQTRSVVCIEKVNFRFNEVSETNCNYENKPNTTRSCYGNKKICDQVDFFGLWSKCSLECEKTRSVVCISFNETDGSSKATDCDEDKYQKLLKEKCLNDENIDDIDLIENLTCNYNLTSDVDQSPCSNNTFGCCPGSDIPAKGKNYLGCAVIQDENCKISSYGCCRDEKTIPLGPFQLGCEIPCNQTKYGCCQDNVTIALEENYMGCVKVPACKSSEFGCCDDDETIALDENKSNCEETTTKNPVNPDLIVCRDEDIEGSGEKCIDIYASCESGEYKCCPDGKTLKLNTENFKCPEVKCSETKFGCCLDNETIAKGVNYEGCNKTSTVKNSCNLSEFGCCPDGITNSTNQGCPCHATTYGCCLDGVTTATGANFTGCYNCSTSQYGCCEDGKTAARGIIEEAGKILDCPCDATKFGCCPDHLTVALGPNYLGCPCNALEYGCCPDEKTPAKGPAFQGCDCNISPHGCCSDGISVAYGPNYLGCPDGPSLDIQFATAVCSLPNERGPCRNYTVKWYFDLNYGGCTRFWYGGCEGNGNRFESQEDCEQSCVKPTGKNACNLPLVKGSCNSTQLVWGYNNQRHTCERFYYGGCLGNFNRFENQEICEQTCFHTRNEDPCEQELNFGTCSENLIRFYFNKQSARCDMFYYSGCNGNQNNFYSLSECENRCAIKTENEICLLEPAKGKCLGKYARYYYDYRTSSCKEFTYSGCEGNNNRFVDKSSCERLCSNIKYQQQKLPSYSNQYLYPQNKPPMNISTALTILETVCNSMKEPGNCNSIENKWWFNSETSQCEVFLYSGCGGNQNKFATKKECEIRCIQQIKQYRIMQQQLINQFTPQFQNQYENYYEENVCLQKRVYGNCTSFSKRWYFDKDDNRCHEFYYSGCGGNHNNFVSLEDCLERCKSNTQPKPNSDKSIVLPLQKGTDSDNKIDPRYQTNSEIIDFKISDCFLRYDSGYCNNDETRWYYDSSDGICKQFSYRGCGGNNNRFMKANICQAKCWNSQDICKLPRAQGSCSKKMAQWYFDKETGECHEFFYSGCEGNANKFSSKEICIKKCGHVSKNNSSTLIAKLTENGLVKNKLCLEQSDQGNCYNYLQQFYYDILDNTCKIFVYSGCGGNYNRFNNREQCVETCVIEGRENRQEPTSQDNPGEVCFQQFDRGFCEESYVKWYYDPSSFTCKTFKYSGCGGNKNVFSTFDSCYKFCGQIEFKVESHLIENNSIDENRIILPPVVSSTTPSIIKLSNPNCNPEQCEKSNCHFGIDYYLDSENCSRCRCSHPCYTHFCPKNQGCAVEVYRTEDGQPRAQPICRLINKPGSCPTITSLLNSTAKQDNCVDTCRNDADCRSIDKCCHNGCANVCITAVEINIHTIEAVTDSSVLHSVTGAPVLIVDSHETERLVLKVKQNETAVLKCGLLADKQQVKVNWSKIGSESPLETLDGRITVDGNGILLIYNANLKDSGEYTCVYLNKFTNQQIVKTRILEIYVPTKILPGNNKVIAQEKSDAILYCDAVGHPKPTVTWWKGNKFIKSDKQKYYQSPNTYQLVIMSVEKSDEGEYICQAYNNYERPQSFVITLLLEFQPNLNPSQQQLFYSNQNTYTRPIMVKANLITEAYKTGSSLQIECLVDGIPKPVVTWYYNDKLLNQGINRINQKSLVTIQPEKLLKIEKLNKEDSGIYSCLARNENGQESSNVTITVEDIYVPAKCENSDSFKDCDFIVLHKYCSIMSYRKVCCKSCLLDGQITHEEVLKLI